VPAGVAHAQTATGEVNARSDKSGGLWLRRVKLTNLATKIEDRAATNSDGLLRFINVNQELSLASRQKLQDHANFTIRRGSESNGHANHKVGGRAITEAWL